MEHNEQMEEHQTGCQLAPGYLAGQSAPPVRKPVVLGLALRSTGVTKGTTSPSFDVMPGIGVEIEYTDE